MDYSLQHHRSYVGKQASDLPTPAFLINLPILKRNIETLHRDVEALGISFRPHVKTLKSIEVTRLMLGRGKYRSIVASTLAEIRGALPLVDEGILDECLYGLPICPGYLPQLSELRKSIRILLMVDNEQQLEILDRFGAQKPWDVFIKLDVGSHRAGIAAGSPSLRRLVDRAEKTKSVNVHGFYCHAGHSYGGKNQSEAETTLGVEIASVLDAATLLPADRPIVLSIGSTPTAHVVRSLKTNIPANIKLELHAGNFPCNDLQQVSTGVIQETDQAIQVATEVCGVYPERNEALVNAGVVALSRETSGYTGFGRVVGKPNWGPMRLSQEHGILASTTEDARVEHEFSVGQRVNLYCNHSCITAAAFYVYYVVDQNDVVIDTWLPWKGW